ncbi:MAG: HAMP domain-containing sensor histidine kinase [Anaerolineae bacterium]|nr:HAMP domain-containing sensor histidine kinase [Anaerolineae bacterium]
MHLTLRLRLALWYMALLAVTAAALIVVINGLAAALIPPTIIPLHAPELERTEEVNSPASSNPLAVVIPQERVSLVVGQTLDRVQAISLFALFLLLAVGSGGAYYLTTVALKPVHRLRNAIASIEVQGLDRHLSIDGPADEVKDLGDAFDAMLDRLNQAFLQQSRFVANAAHELRTPLASMRSNLEVVHMDQEATLSDYQEMASTLDEMLGRLEQLVTNLLLLARQEYEKADDEVLLLPLLEEVVATLSTKAAQYQVDLCLNGKSDLVVTGDPVLLALVFSNLIENGIGYNRPGGSVEVTIREEGDWAVITVADTGVGIPLEEQGEVFERFRRLDTSHRREGEGAGLGLSIVAHIVSLHRGQIELESSPGVGTTFSVRLSLA